MDLFHQLISILGYALVQLPDLLFFIYDRLKSHFMHEKTSTSTLITVMKVDSQGSLASGSDSKSLHQAEAQLNSGLSQDSVYGKGYCISIGKRIVQVKYDSSDDIKIGKRMLDPIHGQITERKS